MKRPVTWLDADKARAWAHRIITSGGLILLDVATRAEAVDYIENVPFFKIGVFSTYTIRRWRKISFDHKRVPV